MVACGTSGLFGGRRVFVVFPLLVDDNSLIPAFPVFVVAFFATGFLVAALAAVFFGLAIFFFSLKNIQPDVLDCYQFTFQCQALCHYCLTCA
jgi:hypothetical protein